jgi:hypothetical protein
MDGFFLFLSFFILEINTQQFQLKNLDLKQKLLTAYLNTYVASIIEKPL